MTDHPTRTRLASGDDTRDIDLVRFRSWRILVGTLATPIAWFAQMLIGEMLTAQACSISDPLRPSAPPSWVTPALIALSVVCFVAGVVGLAIALRTVTLTRAKRWHALDGRARRVAELERFLATVSALSSAMFMFGLISTDLAVLVVWHCDRW
ncbi:Cytochrome c oxidase polypeptide I (plasmid) [Paraburkholderia caribensis MBA4]|uniref:Cytochrome c oxidase polypeptide I n=1 Tax=Paraburkholderia caribensis MBA4 TaxID=1323664 RepID=A0A0P0RRB7_9BURK|nr:hypothetical protein [Paraburkholderia caribensis]ALL71632.1 Cytochrome c oxidase polypeptide I [Paraburkholderia caribensis MBA4]